MFLSVGFISYKLMQGVTDVEKRKEEKKKGRQQKKEKEQVAPKKPKVN